jgi:hypothetical protein
VALSINQYIDRLAAMPDAQRRRTIGKLSQAERKELLRHIQFRHDNKWLQYLGDPVRFVEEGLGETLWSKQKEVLQSVADNKRTAVPACHAPGKTHLAARLAAYWIAVHPPGTALVVTTATNFRQVKSLLWPHIRRIQMTHELMGTTSATAWTFGPDELAVGVKPPDDAEAGISGYHKPHLLIIVDEGGGIKKTFGDSIEALMTGVDTRLLVLGNPPVDGEKGEWFEKICTSPLYNTVPIPYDATPAFTGEYSGQCKTCPPEVDPHEVVQHLIDEVWVENLRSEFGEDSAWFQARALARFVKDGSNKTLPAGWLSEAMEPPEEGHEPAPGRIKLGCDIAADGGDEFAIARLDGWAAKIVHSSRGAENENAPHVAGVILHHIREAEKDHEARGITQPVQVKIDAIGVGWGVAGILQQWEEEHKFKAHIVAVNVAEKARDSTKFYNQRAEMWWTLRELIQPNALNKVPVFLEIDTKEMAQLNTPTYGSDSTARILIEKKADMKKRGKRSPDRAEAMLLAYYEPPGSESVTLGVVEVGQSDPWSTI